MLTRRSLWLAATIPVAAGGGIGIGQYLTPSSRLGWGLGFASGGVIFLWHAWMAVAVSYGEAGRKRRSRQGLVVAWILVPVVVLGACSSGGRLAPSPDCPEAYDASFGQRFVEGPFEVVLTGAYLEAAADGERTVTAAPYGQWFVVHGTIKNVGGTGAEGFSPDGQDLRWCFRTYTPHPKMSTRQVSLNPELGVEFRIVYDVPSGFPDGRPVVVRIQSDSGVRDSTRVLWAG